MPTAQPQIPDKRYFKIGEVAQLVGVRPYVLRYWEKEFGSIRPGKTRSRHRLYRQRDIATLLEIKRLLHVERYTIEGAKRHLRTALMTKPTRVSVALGERTYKEILRGVKRDLEELYQAFGGSEGRSSQGEPKG